MGYSRYIIGIDLGTTNSALAYVDLGDGKDLPTIRLFKVPQLVAEARVESAPGLPSFLYLPGPHDLQPGATALPWEPARGFAVGAFARDQGALVPARLVSSAKSWLCHPGVDRKSPLLPWGSPSDVPHLSPVEASARYLAHLREAWNHTMSKGRPEWCLQSSDVVLTVPASFDEVARELTVEAARMAGIERLTLLEEPQAAFYSWVRGQGDAWQELLHDGQTVLVCDVGGGTTDFSLIAVRRADDALSLERIAVGDHLMLGGDNMDLAIARHLERRLVKRTGELDPRQWSGLVHACRQAKEALLSLGGPDRCPIHIAGRGSKLVGGSVRIDVFADEVSELVLDGFFPVVAFDAEPARPRVGLQELGLPYAAEPAVTRNLASFLRRHNARPDAVLFNGGAMKATLAQDRLVELLTGWFGKEPLVLETQSLDLSVALGAAAYGLARAGNGLRIRGGTARAYYIGVEPGRGLRQAVCLIPFGAEEGDEVSLPDARFELLTDRPVNFPLYCSTAPLGHDAGQLVAITDDVFVNLPPLYTVLSYDKQGTARSVPVSLGAALTEIGTLKMWCAALESKHRWDLEFSLRGAEPGGEEGSSAPGPVVGDASLTVSEAQLAAAQEQIRTALAPRVRTAPSATTPQTVLKELETLLGAPRLDWPGGVIRALFGAVWEASGNRAQSPVHEAAWLNLAGILLRPGFGDPLDPGRVDNLWSVFRGGLHHNDELYCRVGWWVLWRRVSGGLNRGQQLELCNKLSPELLSGAAVKAAGHAGKTKKGKKGKQGGADDGPTLNRQELSEMWRAVASLERIPKASKEGLGDVALRNAVAGRGDFAFFSLGRLGARVPLYGSLEDVVSREKAEAWLDRLLGLDWDKARGIALCVAQLARLAGDPTRDISDGLRAKLTLKLKDAGCPESLRSLLSEVQLLGSVEQGQLFGDALPSGLRLVSGG